MQSKLKEQLALLRINVDKARQGSRALNELAAQPVAASKQTDWLERALNAERRLECLARLAAAVMPPQHGESGGSYVPPSAWRALAREIARANRHLARTKQPSEET